MKKIVPCILGAVFLTSSVVFAGEVLSITNHFQTGVVDIALNSEEHTKEGLLPGETVEAVQNVKNSGNDCYVRAKLNVDIENVTYSLGENWKLYPDGYAYCTDILESGSSANIMKSFTLPEYFSEEKDQIALTVSADAIQSKNFDPDWESESPWGKIEIQKNEKDGPCEVNSVVKKNAFHISYEGDSKKLLANAENFFENFADVMPGDVYSDSVIIKNDSKKEVELFFEQKAQKSELLGQVVFSIDCDKKNVFTGKMQDHMKHSFVLAPEESKEISFTVKVPESLDNAYTLMDEEVNWTFSTEEKSFIDNIIDHVQTGETRFAWMLIPAVLACISGVVLIKKKKN